MEENQTGSQAPVDIIKESNVHVIGGQKEKPVILWYEQFFEGIMDKYLLNLVKNMIYRSKRLITPSNINVKTIILSTL